MGPDQPEPARPMPLQSFRCPAVLWHTAQEKARHNNTNVASILRAHLATYIAPDQSP